MDQPHWSWFLSHLYPAHTLHCFPATSHCFFLSGFYELAGVKSVNTDNGAVTVHSVLLLTVSPKSPAVIAIPLCLAVATAIKVQDVGEAGGPIQRVTEQVTSVRILFSSSVEDTNRIRSWKKRGPSIYLSKNSRCKRKGIFMGDKSLADLLAYLDKNPHGVNVTIIRPKSE